MHDCILYVTSKTNKKNSTREELIEVFNKLPEGLKGEAYGECLILYGEISLLNGTKKIVYRI